MRIFYLFINLYLLFLFTGCAKEASLSKMINVRQVSDIQGISMNIANKLPKDFALSYLNNSNKAIGKNSCIFQDNGVKNKSGEWIDYDLIDIDKIESKNGNLYIVLDEVNDLERTGTIGLAIITFGLVYAVDVMIPDDSCLVKIPQSGKKQFFTALRRMQL